MRFVQPWTVAVLSFRRCERTRGGPRQSPSADHGAGPRNDVAGSLLPLAELVVGHAEHAFQAEQGERRHVVLETGQRLGAGDFVP